MRVVVACPYSLSRPGGVQGQVTGLARALRAAGHQVAVMAPDDSQGPGMVEPTTFSVGRSSAVRSNGSVAPVSLSPGSAVRAHRFVRGYAPDVVHLHEPLAPLAGYGCLVGSPVPVVGTYHRAGDSRAYRALGPVARWADGRLAARCAVSAAAAATIGSVVGRDCRVLFNGVEVDRFGGAEPWPTEGPTVLFLGRHEQRKGLGVLLEAFARVPDPAVLWVAGDGPATGELRRRHPESGRLRWLGMLDDDEVARRLAGADALCAPSLGGESFGMVLLEA
ncbi:MAG TPA: glycosyltransferase family 4 protein, partial [Acidimicrobiales bacterium]|nr:glycosyltransferase family 4 protein [Acidimicrobiales bacterium]